MQVEVQVPVEVQVQVPVEVQVQVYLQVQGGAPVLQKTLLVQKLGPGMDRSQMSRSSGSQSSR